MHLKLLGTLLIIGTFSSSSSPSSSSQWRVCDVSRRGAVGDGRHDDSSPIRSALRDCDEVVLPVGHAFVSGPLNLTSNQVLRVDGQLLASQDAADYPLVAPLLGYGWGDDMNCFPPDAAPHKIVVGSLRYSPVVGAFHQTNVSIVGSGTIDGRGQPWWSNCSKCHYPPNNDSSFCEIASRPKLIEFQFCDGVHVGGASTDQPLTMKNSPFWTLTPTLSQNLHIHDLRIEAPMDRIGNTDGCNLDSCRRAVVENLHIANSDDGVCMKSGLDGFGMNLAVPTEDVLVRNVTCAKGYRGGLVVGSEMSGGVRNITFRDSFLHGERGIHLKTSVGRGGYIRDVLFENIVSDSGISLGVGRDGEPLEPGNRFVPIVDGLRFVNVTTGGCSLGCSGVNGSKCHGVSVAGPCAKSCENSKSCEAAKLAQPRYSCKTMAHGQFGPVTLPWGAGRGGGRCRVRSRCRVR